MRFVHIGRGESRLIGRNDRQAFRVGPIDQRAFGAHFLGAAMTLQLDIKPARRDLHQLIEQ